MEKRIFIAIGVSIAFLWIWAAIAPRFFPELTPKPKPAAAKTATTATTAAPSPSVAAAAPGRRTVAEAATATPVSETALRFTTVENHTYIAKFSNRGAQLVSFQLKKYRDKSGNYVELVKARNPGRNDFPFFIESENAGASERLNTALYAVSDRVDRNVRVIEYRFTAPDGLSATKTFRISQEYLIDFAIRVSPAVRYRVIIGPGIRTLTSQEENNKVIVTGHGVVQRDGKLKVFDREKGDRLSIFENAEFIGIEDNYFLTVLKPSKGGAATLRYTPPPRVLLFPREGAEENGGSGMRLHS